MSANGMCRLNSTTRWVTEQGYALNAGLHAFAAHTYGSPYWKAKLFGNATVDGLGITTGTEADWWNCLVSAGHGMMDPREARDEIFQGHSRLVDLSFAFSVSTSHRKRVDNSAIQPRICSKVSELRNCGELLIWAKVFWTPGEG